MILTINTEDSRDVRALQLAATAGTWETMDGAFLVRSSDGTRTYVTTAETCSCIDSQRGHVCYHRRAIRIHLALRETVTPAPKPVEAPFPVAVREGEETVFLSRREARRRSTKIHLGTVWSPATCGATGKDEATFSTVLDPSLVTCADCLRPTHLKIGDSAATMRAACGSTLRDARWTQNPYDVNCAPCAAWQEMVRRNKN
jgi:hypothetical protein